MRHFHRFLSTFETARVEFGESGRQKSDIHPVFCLLLVPHALNLDQPVDKNHTFTPFFVYFRYRAPRFRRTAEIPPKQETLRRCLMPAALHFEFPSRRFLVSFRPRIKSRPRFTENDALSTTKKRSATCRFGLGRVAKTISNFPR